MPATAYGPRFVWKNSAVAADPKWVERDVFTRLAKWGLARDGLAAVAFSGGGDSTALLALITKWFDKGRVFAFIIDHGLRPQSSAEARLAKARAEALGARAEILTCDWPQGRPETGLQEKARQARYAHLARACDALDGSHIPLFLGHNRDDQLETVFMRRQAGSGWRGLAGMAECAPLPVVSTTKNVRVMRPLLAWSREELRLYNQAQALKWIDDPSNSNKTFARIRARERLKADPLLGDMLTADNFAARETLEIEKQVLFRFLTETTKITKWGGLVLSGGFLQAPTGQIAEALRYLLPTVSGQFKVISSEQRRALARSLRGRDFKGATLGGVRFAVQKEAVLCVRDMGALTGRHQKPALAPLPVSADARVLWDHRFSITSQHAGQVVALAVCSNRLSKAQKEMIKDIPSAARGGLPVLQLPDGQIRLPDGAGMNTGTGFYARALLSQRLQGLLRERCESFSP